MVHATAESPELIGNAAATAWPAEQMLETVKASPLAVAAHARSDWLALFGDDAVVQDPVGTAPCDGPVEIGRFYDTFIAQTSIHFESSLDLVAGNLVVRDVLIQTTMDSGLSIEVPAHLVYELAETVDGLKITGLNAYWELRRMIPQVLGQGIAGLRTMLALSWRMLTIQGIGTTVRYSDGMLRGIFAEGKADTSAFAAACGGSQVDLRLRTASDFGGVELPGRTSAIAMEQLFGHFDGPLTLRSQLSAGYHSSFVFDATLKGDSCQGFGVFEYDTRSRKIDRIRLVY